ncbi:hypothetical protein BDZ45DRAFT_744025 [Acephala macrosclerotiorum]|nr:hypothetical protein BDZ45DRAFT_744025 [Acephala macrosclerotiorum]
MRRVFTFSALVACCLSFGFITPSFPNAFLGEPSTVSWDGETALPVSLTLLSNATSGGWVVAAGIYNSEFTWTPWNPGNLDDGFVMLLVDGNGDSSSSLPFLIQDPSIEIISVSSQTDTLSTNTAASDESDLVLSPRSVISSAFQDFSLLTAASTNFPSLPAAVSTFVAVSAPSAMPTLITITASFIEEASTTIIASYPAAASTTVISSLPAIVFSTETASAPLSSSTDTGFGGEFAVRADVDFKGTSKQVIKLTGNPQNLTSTSNSTTLDPPSSTSSTKIRLVVAITIIVLLVFLFCVLVAFEYGKRVAVRSLKSDCGECFHGEAELLRMYSNRGLRPSSLLRINPDKAREVNGSENGTEMAEPVSAAERNDSKKGNFGRKSMRSVYEMA